MSAQSQAQNQQEDYENKDILALLLSKTKRYIFHRNYLLTQRSTANYLYATILNTITYIQMYIAFSMPQYNIAITEDSDVYFLVEKGIFLLCKLNVQTELNINSMTIIALGAIQLLLISAYAIPISSKEGNIILSKYFIQVFSALTFIPAIYIGTENILNSQSIYVSLLTLVLTLINRLLFITMHFEFSISGLNQNILIRNPLSTTKEILSYFLFMLFLLCKSFLYPMSLLICLICNMAFCLLQVKDYCVGFIYHHQSIPKLIGILKIMKISIALCYLIVIATEITLVKKNILTFILAFFVFFANFFLIFKKYSTKSIVIDSEGSSQTKKILFIMWYFNCFRNRAQKKNQLYLSSLLKNHSTECKDINCCCRKRLTIYDPSANMFGSPSSQPHQDIVYIKHFFLKLLTETYKEFPKCNEILFLLAFYNLQILNFIPQTIELIKELKKKSLKKNLTFSEDYLLYCLGERCYSKINEINQDRGNLNLQEVRRFDLRILELKETIKFSVQTFSSLWKTICSEKYNQKNLVQICKVALEVMFKIQQIYKDVKSINNVSTELKQLMIFYSKSVAHDIHLLSQIRKEIKLNASKSIISNLTEIKGINIFSPDTITLITSEICNIRWASKNCYSIFGYNDRDEFLKLKINDLMPKYFSENHDNYINKWLQNGFSTKLNKSTYLWGSTKDGFCFSLALYIKIIPLQKEQDFAFFAAIEKIDIDNEIICNDEGEILGCGKLFATTIKCSQKTIQDYKPNIMIFIPTSFEIFFEKFYEDKKMSQQIMVETRREGYFPKNLETILKQISKQKQVFMTKNARKTNINELMCSFLKQKMQQITVYMDGQYISFISTVHELPVLENKKKNIIVFKLTGFKKNNVEKYYNELEKMIVKLEQVKNTNNTIKKKKSLKGQHTKEIKKDYFKMLLNPKRVKKILQQEDQEPSGADDDNSMFQFGRLNAITRKPQDDMNPDRPRKKLDTCIVDAQRMICFRKKLALNAQDEIKCERAKYNIWRIKKSLFEEGVFSRYTYNILIGKGNVFETMHQTYKANQMFDDPFLTLGHKDNVEEEQNNSEDDLSSQNLTNKMNTDNNADKPNDNETFNSATSSAAFISMTNSIKMFKIKLRSLNTPKLLYWLNVGLIFLILLMAGFGVWQELQEIRQAELGQIFFTKGVQCTWAIDGLLMSKLMIQKLQHLTDNINLIDPTYFNQTQAQLNRMISVELNLLHNILSVQLNQFSELKTKDPSLLSYLFLQVPKHETMLSGASLTSLQVIEFMMREEDFAKKGINVRNQQQIQFFLKQHQNVFQQNIYYKALEEMDQNLFLGGIVAFLVALAISIPIVYKIESKVEEIMYLISKISLNERKKYYLQFTLLSEQLKHMNETQTWGDLQGIQEAKLNNFYLKGHSSQDMFSEQKSSEKSPLLPQNQQKTIKTKFYSTIYFKIIIIYLVFLIVYSTKFVYVKVIFDDFLLQNDIFTNILAEKLRMTDEALLFNQYLVDNDTQGLNIRQSQLVQEIYSSYHLEARDNSRFDDYIDNLTTSDICVRIQDQLSSSEHLSPYLRFFVMNATQEIFECQQLSNSSLSKGLFSTLDFIKQKRLDIISRSLAQRESFSLSKQSISLQKLTYYSNTMVYLIQQELRAQVNHKKGKLMFQMSLWLLIVLGVLLLFTIAWIFIYLNIAERASYINAFLLLIPYEVLSENPYIKLYIKNQFDYKASVY